MSDMINLCGCPWLSLADSETKRVLLRKGRLCEMFRAWLPGGFRDWLPGGFRDEIAGSRECGGGLEFGRVCT